MISAFQYFSVSAFPFSLDLPGKSGHDQCMSTLVEIEAAAEVLPPEQKIELIRFLETGLRSGRRALRGARLVDGPKGTLLLEAPPGAPAMTTETVKQLLEDFP